MSNYFRVIPRDLFNEASLLKCYGRLWIALDETPDHRAEMHHDDEAFDIVQNESTGGISIRNVRLTVAGQLYHLERPLNSRDAWPLYAESDADPDADPIEVFDDSGNLTPEMRALIQ